MSDQLDKFSKELAAFSQSLERLRRTRGELKTSLQVGECIERLGSIVEMLVGDILQTKSAEQKITLDIRGDVSRVTLGENDTLVVKVKSERPMVDGDSERVKSVVAEVLGIPSNRIVVVAISPTTSDIEFGVVRESES